MATTVVADKGASLAPEALERAASHYSTGEGFAHAIIHAALLAAAEEVRAAGGPQKGVTLSCEITVSPLIRPNALVRENCYTIMHCIPKTGDCQSTTVCGPPN